MNGLKWRPSKNSVARGAGLVAVVLADHAGLRLRIVGRADARQEHQVHVVDCIGAQQHDGGRLLEFLAVEHVGVGDAGDALAVGILQHLGDPCVGAQLEVGIGERERDDGDVRAAFGIRLAAELLAVAAILAGAEFWHRRGSV